MTNYAPRILVVCEFTANHYLTGIGQGLNYDDNYYQGKIKNLPDVSLASDDWIQSDISIDVANADNEFSTSEDYAGKTIKYYIYDDDAESATLWFSGLVESFSVGTTARFNVKPRPDSILDKEWPPKKYETDDWRTHADGNVNDSTIYNPNKFGSSYQIPIGYFNKLELIPVYYNTVSDYYDYICAGPIEEFTNVYRDNRVIDSSEYSWDDGTDGKYVDGDGRAYAYVRFSKRQLQNGNYLTITADGKGLVMGGASAQRNFINVIKFLLSDDYWGLNQSINAASFTASAALSHVSPLLCDGVIGRDGTGGSLRNILEELCKCCFSFVYRNTSDEWQIYTDQTIASASLTIGPDSTYQVQEITDYSRVGASESLGILKCEYGYNTWTQKYNYETSERTVNNIDNASDETWQFNFVDDAETADRIACYYQQDGLLRKFRLSYKGGLEGHSLTFLQKVTIVDKVYYGEDGLVTHVNGDFVIFSIKKDEGGFQLIDCKPYNASVFTYSAGTLPTDAYDDDETDYTYTPPSAPSSLTIAASGTRQGSDGTTTAYYRLTAVAPSVNYKYLQFGYKEKNEATTNYHWFDGTESSGTWYATIEGLVPGQLYYFGTRAINPDNDESATNGAISELTNGGSGYTAPGDTSAPSAPTGLAATARTGKLIELDWDDNAEDDFSVYYLYRNTVNNSGTATKIAEIRVSKYPDTTPSYTTYYYWLKAVDYTGNVSNFSSGANATTVEIGNSDISGMNFDKLGNGTATAKTFQMSTSGGITFNSGTAVTINSGSNVYINSGGTFNVYGSTGCNIKSGGAINIESGADIDIESGGDINVLSGGSVKVTAGTIAISSTGSLTMSAGTMTLSGGTLTMSGATVNITSSTLNISSTGQINVTTASGIYINSANGINLLVGSDILMNFTSANSADIYWDGGAVGDMKISGDVTTQASAPYTDHPTLNIGAISSGLGYLDIGYNNLAPWYYIGMRATYTINLKIGSTYQITMDSGNLYPSAGTIHLGKSGSEFADVRVDNSYYFGSWDWYNNGTEAQLRYSSSWKFSVDSNGDAYAYRHLIAQQNVIVYNQLSFDNGEWTVEYEAGTGNLLFKRSGTTRVYFDEGGAVVIYDGNWHTLTY